MVDVHLWARTFLLPRTSLPELYHVGKQLNNLNRLCSLYNEVNTFTREIQDQLLVDIAFSEIFAAMGKFQSDSKKVPAEKRSWSVHTDLNQRIDNLINNATLRTFFRFSSSTTSSEKNH
jgi:hypothetical protein